jgi:hypothetical protein
LVDLPANENPSIAAGVEEFTAVHDRVVHFRACARFISSKLTQFFVTDDLATLAKDLPMSTELQAAFDGVDRNEDQVIDLEEWESPVPVVLPNGRPPQVFDRLDADGSGQITAKEYQEPDLLEAAIQTWANTDGDMREVLRTILLSDEFLSLKHERALVKNPLGVVTSTTHVLAGAQTIPALINTIGNLEVAGQELYEFGDPTGESVLGFDLMHTVALLERLRFIGRAVNPPSDEETRLVWNPEGFVAAFGLTTAEKTVSLFVDVILGGEVLANQRLLAVQAYETADPGSEVLDTVEFIMSLPQFQKK